MPATSNAHHSTAKCWHDSLKTPKGKLLRDETVYPSTPLGELAYRFREAFDLSEGNPPPSSRELAYTTHLIQLLSRDMRRIPFRSRPAEDLALMNYLATPREIYPQTEPLLTATRAVIAEGFFNDTKAVQATLKHGWRDPDAPSLLYPLQQLTLHIGHSLDAYEEISTIVSNAAPPSSKYNTPFDAMSGAFALFSLAREAGCKKAPRILVGAALPMLYELEKQSDEFSLEPLARPLEYRWASLFLADLLRVKLSRPQSSTETRWEPSDLESIDITRAWLEGRSSPLANFIEHTAALRTPKDVEAFRKLYQRNGVRNVLRLKLAESAEPWALRDALVEQMERPRSGQDIILCAIGSGDHNDAFASRAWDFEHIRQQGEEQGWSLDFIEVRDAQELALHILHYGEEGSRIRALHYFGHGSSSSGEFGQLERMNRSELSLRKLFSGSDEQELLASLRRYVDTIVLHTCSAAQPPSERNRKISNLMEGLYFGTHKEVSVVGLTGNDAFHALNHKRTRNNQVIFVGRPVWYGIRSLRGKHSSN